MVSPALVHRGQPAANTGLRGERDDRELVALVEEIGDEPAALDHVRERIALHRPGDIDHEHQGQRRALGLERLAARLDLDRCP